MMKEKGSRYKMKAYDFINTNIGERVRVVNNRDLALTLKHLFGKELYLVKLSRSGMAILTDGKKEYSVPPYGIRLYLDPTDKR